MFQELYVRPSRVIPLVLCGGASRRLWPIQIPKQFLHIHGQQSLLQKTIARIQFSESVTAPILSCNVRYEDSIQSQMNAIGLEDYQFIAEPEPRNTAPAVLVSALVALKKQSPDDILLILPSDHLIDNDEAYQAAVKQAIELAKENHIAMIGIKPTSPHTGFGYIETGLQISDSSGYFVSRFVEKPSLEQAEKYLKNQSYFWNSGIYVMKIKTLLTEARQYCPQLLDACQRVVGNTRQEGGHYYVQEADYLQAPDIPLDKAISEHTHCGVLVPAQFQWKDLGSWSSMADMDPTQKDQNGNVIQGNIMAQGVHDCYIQSLGEKPIIAIGLDNVVIVDTPEGLLITRKDMEQDVRSCSERLSRLRLKTMESCEGI